MHMADMHEHEIGFIRDINSYARVQWALTAQVHTNHV